MKRMIADDAVDRDDNDTYFGIIRHDLPLFAILVALIPLESPQVPPWVCMHTIGLRGALGYNGCATTAVVMPWWYGV